jgi:hypothetical protein
MTPLGESSIFDKTAGERGAPFGLDLVGQPADHLAEGDGPLWQ